MDKKLPWLCDRVGLREPGRSVVLESYATSHRSMVEKLSKGNGRPRNTAAGLVVVVKVEIDSGKQIKMQC